MVWSCNVKLVLQSVPVEPPNSACDKCSLEPVDCSCKSAKGCSLTHIDRLNLKGSANSPIVARVWCSNFTEFHTRQGTVGPPPPRARVTLGLVLGGLTGYNSAMRLCLVTHLNSMTDSLLVMQCAAPSKTSLPRAQLAQM